MITVDTTREVRYLNADGAKKAARRTKRAEKRPERIEKARNIWQAGKDTGLLAGIENVLLGNRGAAGLDAGSPLPDPNAVYADPNAKTGGWSNMATWKKATIIIAGLAVAGGIAYMVVKSKKPA